VALHDVADAELLPQVLEDIDASIGPGVPDGNVPSFTQQRGVVREDAQDALGESLSFSPSS